MTRFLMTLALAAMISGCATTATNDGSTDAAKSTASADSSEDDKRCLRVTQTGSNMSQRRCTKENR